MDTITKPSIQRLALRSGVKTISNDCFDKIKDIMLDRIDTICYKLSIYNKQSNTKTIMASDLYETLNQMGINLTKSSSLNDNVYSFNS